jgi:hypothetical protein
VHRQEQSPYPGRGFQNGAIQGFLFDDVNLRRTSR